MWSLKEIQASNWVQRWLLFCIVRTATENAEIGFQFLRYQCLENSNQQVCLVVNGYISSNVHVVVNTHEGTAGESKLTDLMPTSDFYIMFFTILTTLDENDYTPLRSHNILIRPGTSKTCFTVNVINNLAVEDNETFTITLEVPAGGLRSGITINKNINVTVIKIIDDDGKLYIFILELNLIHSVLCP